MHALRVLEYDAVRRLLQEHCETALSRAWAGELEPIFSEAEVWQQIGLTAEAHHALGHQAPPSLYGIRDLRDPVRRATKGGVLGGQELWMVGAALETMRSLREYLEHRASEMPLIGPSSLALPTHPRLEEILLGSLDSDGTVRDSASATLASLRQRQKGAQSRLQEKIQAYLSGKSRDLLSDPIVTTRDGRYVIPLKAEHRGKIKGVVHDTSGSGSTIYLEPDDVLAIGNQLRELEAAEREEIVRILTQFSQRVGAVGAEINGGIEVASRIDLWFAKARLAYAMRASVPQKARDSAFLKISAGRHPLLPREQVVPLDLEVSRAQSVLITGPNTGGKTVAIKCAGLFVLMAQSGLLLPALEVQFGVFSQVWADIGDEQSLQQSLSTFSGHIRNIAAAIKDLKPGAIVLLDEVGAGTDPAEGAALARAMLARMMELGAAILASTHYGELKAFAYSHPQLTNAAMEFDGKSFRPTYRLLMGAPGASHALKIAERYGIPEDVVEKARESLGEQAQDVANMLERLEAAQRQARAAQSEADRRANEMRRAGEEASRKLKEAEEIRRTANLRAQEVIESALREIRLEAQTIFEELKSAPKQSQALDKARLQLKELDAVGRHFAQEIGPKREARAPAQGLSRGDRIRLVGTGQTGAVLEDPRDGKVLVQLGALKMTLGLDQVQKTEERQVERVKAKPSIRLTKAMTATTEVDLRHLRAEEAVRELEKFVDDAVLGSVPGIRIVHGKGEGVLRKVVQEFLKKNDAVVRFRDGEPAEGGHGVTVAWFE